MSQVLARVMLAVLMIPSAAILHLSVYAMAERMPWHLRWPRLWLQHGELVLACVVMWAFIATYWITLWRRTVRWTTWRTRATVWTGGAAAAAGVLAGLLVGRRFGDELMFFVFSTVTPLIWLTWTVFIWRESGSERAVRTRGETPITCPSCGYNLAGLVQARCPECGTQFTLDELFAHQVVDERTERCLS